MHPSASRPRKALLLASVCTAAMLWTEIVRAEDPTGGEFVYGDGSIDYGDKSTIIHQLSQRALITWDSFSVSSGSSVSFLQPNSSAIALNRILGASPSHIDGSVFANGNVWIINSNGVLFGKGSTINVGGLIATTADIRDADFVSGNYKFTVISGNPDASVVNQGTITTRRGGTAILAGTNVSNEGLIQADMGNVVLASGATFSVDFNGDNLLRFAVIDPVSNAKKAVVSNSGVIRANGGKVTMTARAASNVVDNVVNNSGMIQATSVSSQNGEIVLDAGDGTVINSGTLDASGGSGTSGGDIELRAKNIQVADGAVIDASGGAGGGRVLIGGGVHGEDASADNVTIGHATIKADATEKGNGGTVVVWSKKTTQFNGSVSAKGGTQGGNGGFVETSGGVLTVGTSARVDTRAQAGHTGTWLIDPEFITIVNDGEDGTDGSRIDPRTIAEALLTTNVLLEANQGIDVRSTLAYSSANALGLFSEGDIGIYASVQNAGTGGLYLVAGWDGETTDFSALGNDGVYGNNGGHITIGSDLAAGGIAVGSLGGPTLLAADGITLDASSGYAQIGFHGAGGGDIAVYAAGDLTLIGGRDLAMIGNGWKDGAGSATGDIALHIAGTTALENSATTWIGNRAGNGYTANGDVVVISGDIGGDEGAQAALMRMFLADLGTSDATGGDVTFGLTQGTMILADAMLYDSPHALNFLATGNIDIRTRIQNAGDGAIALVAGWNGTTLDSGLFTQQGVYGNEGGSLILDAEEGDVAVGSAGGLLTVAAHDIDLNAVNGYAQLGYHGGGGGDIDVFASGDLTLIGGRKAAFYAQLGNGIIATDVARNHVTGDVTGDIDVQVAGTTSFDGWRGLAWLGNVTDNADFAASGDVMLTTGTLEGDGRALARMLAADLGTSDATGGDVTLAFTGENGAVLDFALFYDSPHAFSLTSTGDIAIEAMLQNAGHGAINLFAAGDVLIGGEGALGNVAVGSRFGTTNVDAENVLVIADNGFAQLGYRGDGQGDINVRAAGDVTLSGINDTAVIGHSGAETGGTVSVDAGGDILLDAQEGDVRIGNAGAGNVLVAAEGDITLDAAASRSALIGDRTKGGAVRIDAGGTLTLAGPGQTILGFLASSGAHGSVDIAAHSFVGNISPSLASGLHAGDFTMAVADASNLVIDQAVFYDGENALSLSTGGDIVVLASIQNAGHGDIFLQAGGDLTIGGAEAEGDVALGSAHGTTSLFADDIELLAMNGYAQLGYHGEGNGNIALQALGDLTLTGGTGDGFYAQIGNGGAETNKNSEGYTLGGAIDITAANLIMTAGSGDASYVQIGHGGFKSGANLKDGTATIDGDIAIVVSGDVEMNAGGRDAYAQIGNGGSRVNANAASGTRGFIGGDISVLSSEGGDVTLRGGFGANAYAQIGNGGYGFNAPNGSRPNRFTIEGDISVSDLSVLGGTGGNAYAQIGNGDASGTGFGDVSGDIFIDSPTEIIVGGGLGLNAVALIGNDTGTGFSGGAIAGYVDMTNSENNGVVAGEDDKKASAELIVISGAANAVSRQNRPLANRLAALRAKLQTAPLAELAGDAKSAEGHRASDNVASRIAGSLGNVAPAINRTLAGGLLREIPKTAGKTPHGVPSADETYSSWGNDTLWQ